MQATKALTRLRIHTVSLESWLLADAINTKILCVGPYVYDTQKNKFAEMVLSTNNF